MEAKMIEVNGEAELKQALQRLYDSAIQPQAAPAKGSSLGLSAGLFGSKAKSAPLSHHEDHYIHYTHGAQSSFIKVSIDTAKTNQPAFEIWYANANEGRYKAPTPVVSTINDFFTTVCKQDANFHDISRDEQFTKQLVEASISGAALSKHDPKELETEALTKLQAATSVPILDIKQGM